ncbi:MAG: hypothetical protein AB1352_03445 [Patescibacteria group bacterium]
MKNLTFFPTSTVIILSRYRKNCWYPPVEEVAYRAAVPDTADVRPR